MRRYLLARLAQTAVTLLAISVIAFAILHFAPGDPAALLYGPNLSASQLEQIRVAWGLDQPMPLQYASWLSHVVTGDLGRSYVDGRPVLTVIAERIPATLELTLTGLGVALIVGLTAGTLAAMRPRSALGYVVTAVATFLYSMPSFWLGLLLILVFSVWLRWLPSAGMESLRGTSSAFDRLTYLLMPAFVISLRETGRLIRFTKASLLDVLQLDFVRMAEAKGLSEWQAATRHALPNALIPIVTLLGLSVPQLFSSSIVIETVFAWPGMGRLVVESAFQRNYTVLMGAIVIISVLVASGNLLADLAYALVDPRIRYAD
jgi:peptide/nickel transport system permease protein